MVHQFAGYTEFDLEPKVICVVDIREEKNKKKVVSSIMVTVSSMYVLNDTYWLEADGACQVNITLGHNEL
jgi:hypothetical protein